MIHVKNLSYSYPEKDLYNKISFTIKPGQHCALIGTSGTGKSTLVELLMDLDNYMYQGKVTIDPHCRFGYVSQFYQNNVEEDITVFQYIAKDFIFMQESITAICTELETTTDFDSVLHRYQQALDAFEAVHGDDYENNITKKLNLANLSHYKDQWISKLSKGEFKLIQMIKEMLMEPDLLVMDEPDVFLDFDHINALRDLINSHKGTMLVITHNRYLLNHCFDKILHLENKELQEFDGRYLDYSFSMLLGKIDLQERAAADEEEIKRNQNVVDRLRDAATYYTDAARGNALNARVSLLKRLEAKKIKGPFVEIKQPDIHFMEAEPISNNDDSTILNVVDYHLAFEHSLLEHVTFELSATDKVAIVGAIGTGKTTLLREIYQNQSSSIHPKEGLKVGFLSQEQEEMLNESNGIYEEFLDAGFSSKESIEAYLKNYGFETERMNQSIRTLSGGEKNLLQIAKIACVPTNLLLLDEPTSHLDTYAQDSLEYAITKYAGAVLMISHDFYTVANCVDYVLLIEDRTIRRISARKFRKMIYSKHFSPNYLELEKRKKEVETKITTALKNHDFITAKTMTQELEQLVRQL